MEDSTVLKMNFTMLSSNGEHSSVPDNKDGLYSQQRARCTCMLFLYQLFLALCTVFEVRIDKPTSPRYLLMTVLLGNLCWKLHMV